MKNLAAQIMGMYLTAKYGLSQQMTKNEEEGLSQSTENAILLAGAVTIAAAVITIVKSYVEQKLPQ